MRKGLRNFLYSLDSRCSSSGFLSIRPSGEIRSCVDSPSTLDAGTIATLALFSLRRLSPCPLARPKSEPTRLRSWLVAVSRRLRTQPELLNFLSYEQYSVSHSQYRVKRRWLGLPLQLTDLVLLLNSNTAVIGGNVSIIYSPRASVKYYHHNNTLLMYPHLLFRENI